ncbi:UDP-3-O-(3-hydroxymyristoyl)glucosamine N-acyltransferase|uniref:UDP-3-O-(3-hydroxymyristoyl)glucosamine N-acyltransferase n=1 Tax=Delftia acidovorans TaxID=80866 RepID=UPI001CD4041D|nr:UDP-3-O-(3-hydroxymyristoyl)glucosamine N-acyltransferase [Delftia acidovorans]MCA1071826.1 UDP-3-O-(3-hydroxymyristoyl)glucosamine N-acyltransferase [Delftia acidovorans]
MAYRWIIGSGAQLDLAFYAWEKACPEEKVERIEIRQGSDFTFDLSIFSKLEPRQGKAFIAFDERFGNFKRMELMQAALARGLCLESFISCNANIADDALIGMNTFIGPQVSVAHGCQIGFNSVLHAGVNIGARSRIKASCWIESGVQIGAGVEIGSHAILRMGTLVGTGVNIGKGCELGWPRLYRQDIPAKTIFDPRYDEPIHVFTDSGSEYVPQHARSKSQARD